MQQLRASVWVDNEGSRVSQFNLPISKLSHVTCIYNVSTHFTDIISCQGKNDFFKKHVSEAGARIGGTALSQPGSGERSSGGSVVQAASSRSMRDSKLLVSI